MLCRWLFIVPAFLSLGCSVKCGPPAHFEHGEGLVSRADGHCYEFWIGEHETANLPAWQIEQPLPHSIAEIAKVADGEVHNYVASPKEWSVEQVSIQELDFGFHKTGKWFFIVEYHSKTAGSDDLLRIPVLFDGTVVKGTRTECGTR